MLSSCAVEVGTLRKHTKIIQGNWQPTSPLFCCHNVICICISLRKGFRHQKIFIYCYIFFARARAEPASPDMGRLGVLEVALAGVRQMSLDLVTGSVASRPHGILFGQASIRSENPMTAMA